MKSKIQKQVVLTLTEEEARWLKHIVQNPLWTDLKQEDPYDRVMRGRYWDALEGVELDGGREDGTS